MDAETLKKCADNIARNISTPFRVSSAVRSRDPLHGDISVIFLNLMVGSSCAFSDFEVTSCKAYRNLKVLIKQRLIIATLDQRELADDLLRRLGYKET